MTNKYENNKSTQPQTQTKPNHQAQPAKPMSGSPAAHTHAHGADHKADHKQQQQQSSQKNRSR